MRQKHNKIQFKKLYHEGKYIHEITWNDFIHYTIWSDCLEMEGKVGEDFLVPIVPSIKVPASKKTLIDLDVSIFIIKAEFTLADGTKLEGAIEVDPWNKTLCGIWIKIDEEHFGHVSAPPKKFGFTHENLCQELQKKSEEVFPIYFRCSVGFEDEEGIIEGKYPINFRADKGIKLSRKRKINK